MGGVNWHRLPVATLVTWPPCGVTAERAEPFRRSVAPVGDNALTSWSSRRIPGVAGCHHISAEKRQGRLGWDRLASALSLSLGVSARQNLDCCAEIQAAELHSNRQPVFESCASQALSFSVCSSFLSFPGFLFSFFVVWFAVFVPRPGGFEPSV